jgi:hypothetical protein
LFLVLLAKKPEETNKKWKRIYDSFPNKSRNNL